MHLEIAQLVVDHYDKMPLTFPRLPSGPWYSYFDYTGWTDEEGKVFVHLTPFFDPVEDIAERAGRDLKEVQETLDSLYKKGQILRMGKPGAYAYKYMPWGPGTYEAQVKKFTKEFCEHFDQMAAVLETFIGIYGTGTPVARIIPREKALPFSIEVYPTEILSHIITSEAEQIAISDCMCRTKAKLLGRGCDAPRDEMCMWFDPFAEMFADSGAGRLITKEEALKVVDRARKAELVHSAIYCGKPWFVCNCCRDCCDLLMPRVAAGVYQANANANFLAECNIELCNGCEDCVSPCPSQSVTVTLKDKKAQINVETCLGCGLCVEECPQDAITLKRRPKEQVALYPANSDELMRVYARERDKTFWYK